MYAKGYELYEGLKQKDYLQDVSADIQVTTNNSLIELSKKLLDLSRKNKLINFRHTESSKRFVRFIDEVPDITLDKLNENSSFDIISLPDPDYDPEDEKNDKFLRELDNLKLTDEDYVKKSNKIAENDEDLNSKEALILERDLRDKLREILKMPKRKDIKLMSIKEFAKSHNLDPDFNLPHSIQNEEIHTDNKLQTLLTPDKYERILQNILKVNKTQYDEKGVNFLYLVFGFIKWFESDSSDVEILSPLLILNVEISKRSVANRTIYSIKSSGEPIQVNQTINERFKKDFSINLPEFNYETDNIEKYFEKVKLLIQGKNSWELKRFMTLSNLDYSKFLMFEDLKSENWPSGSGFLSHSIINEILYGQRSDASGESFEKTYDLDDENNFKSAPFLIFPADSSQHSAVIDALSQKNFSLKGPPGTGKSQTIANIIGSFLSSNRSVLFLAEKKTAIEVVKKRLNQIGLGHFCLGVTSPKKIEVIDQLKLRLDKTSKLRINDFDDTRDKLLDNLSKLKQYKSIITKEFGNLGMQVYDILFNFLKVSDRITDNEKIILREIELNNIKNNSLNDIEDSKNKLLTLKKLGEEFKNYFKDKENHFKKIQKQLNPIEVDQLKGIISTVPQDIDNLIKLSISKEFEITHNLTFNSFDKLFSFIEKFKNNKFYPKLLINEIQNNSEYVNEINEIQLNIETIIKSFTDFRLDQIINYYKSLTKINDKFETLKDFKKNAKLEIDVIEKLCKKYSNIESDFKNIFSISKNSKDILEIINELFKNKDIILNISRNNCFKDKHLEKENYEILERARNQINELNDIYKTFETEFNLKKASVKFIQKNIQNLKEASSLTWFSSKYKEAKSYYLEISENNLSKIDKDIMISEFAKLLKYKKLEDEFTSNQDFINISLNNIDLFIDKLDVFSEVISFNKTVNDIIKDKKGSLSDNSLNSLLSIKSLNKFFEFYKELAIEEINKLTGSLKNDLLNLDKLFDDNQKQKSEIDKTIIDIDSLFLDENFKVEDIDSLYSQIKSIDKRIENIFKKYSIDIVSILKNFDEEMFSSTSSLINLLAEENYSKQIINYIISLSDKDPKLVEEDIKNIKSNIDNLDNKILKINELIEYDLKNNNLKDILAFCNNFEKDFSMLPKWFEYKKVLENDLSNDQRQFVNFLEEKLNLNNIELYYEFCFFYNLASKLYSENPILNEFGGESLETVRAQYKFLDDQIFDLHSKDIHNTINSRPVPEGISVGRKKDLTEFGLLDYLANTERPRVQGLSLRNLVYKTFNALQTLMPCFMMSPTYASQCLPRETGLFDLLIVDEASQLTPEMCLSSMARARQSIIVGDEKQLPPTNYFQQSEGDSIEEDEDIEVIEEKSILDQSLARFKNIRDLRWHYRSRHQNLISFSNENFYLSRLHIFPNSEPGNDYYGIKYHYVETIYETKINQAEIQKICDLVEDFARNYPKKSSIVVTMNQYQEQEIENEISRRKAKSKELTDYIDYWDLPENKIEKFDVKNLENVQGDERDCVFISTIFGPQIKGKKPRQNFGPINKNTGHRRLNVLFTRAKDRIELITSLKSSDILTESKPLGCKIFADYLLYAETGKLKVRETYGEKDFDSPFQDYVRKEILSMGYEVVNEVGVRGFSIDIGIKDPKNSNKFLCGIECDGATYHSAKSVRDNDKLRQEILEGLGWNIYRIWSTDWFSDKENQVNKLKLYLENLCN